MRVAAVDYSLEGAAMALSHANPLWNRGRDVVATMPSFERYNSVMATTSYLDRLLEPLTDAFTPEVASALLQIRADSELEDRINELRQKAHDGTLTPAEDAEYKDFVEAVDLISIMQAKARRFLARQSP